MNQNVATAQRQLEQEREKELKEKPDEAALNKLSSSAKHHQP